MSSKLKNLSAILLLTIVPTLLIWLPFYLRSGEVFGIPLSEDGMATIVANYDGPLFIVVAKSLYNPELINQFSFTLPAIYYAAHFPLFPLLIRLYSLLSNYPYAMLMVTLTSSAVAIYYFKQLISEFVEEKDVWWIVFIFAIFPARWLIVRSVGSAEPLFIAATTASVYYFRQRKFLWAGVWGAVAQLTKSPGILLFVAYMMAIFFPAFKRGAIESFDKVISFKSLVTKTPLLLIPFSLLALFYFYSIQLNDFFAYFNSGDNIHLFFPPFQIFDYSQPWVGTFWLEEVIFIYLISFLGLLRLIKMKESAMAWFVGVFFLSTIFVSHRDILRYSLPMLPFLMIAYSDILIKKEFKYAMALLVMPIYLFSIAYITNNVMPISNWGPLL